MRRQLHSPPEGALQDPQIDQPGACGSAAATVHSTNRLAHAPVYFCITYWYLNLYEYSVSVCCIPIFLVRMSARGLVSDGWCGPGRQVAKCSAECSSVSRVASEVPHSPLHVIVKFADHKLTTNF